MRMQDEQNKSLLAGRSLPICCLSADLLLVNAKLWLKFLYLIFDKQQKQIEHYLQNNVDVLVQICTSSQRLQRVIHLDC